jgi:putative transposase
MARQPRGTVHAGIYHVTRRSTGPIPMFRDDVDRADFCNRLARTVSNFGWTFHAFVLMTTHYHLLLGVEQDALQPGMSALNGPYAQAFNRRWARSGHLKGGPYWANPVDDDLGFIRCVRYIARNPVEAELCESPADWVWGSYRGCAGYDKGFPFVTNDLVLATLDENRTKAQRLLRMLCEDLEPGSIPGFDR